VVVFSDNSPRDLKHFPALDTNINTSVGYSAGHYVNATSMDPHPWATNFQMYSYVTEDLPNFVNAHFPVDPLRKSIIGHSMGGGAALTIAMREKTSYCSASAFAPVCSEFSYFNDIFEGCYFRDNLEQAKIYSALEVL
jgi:S-formylglutathione hydrolase